MYWANNHASSPHIETILLKEDLTLEELFNEESLIQELKSLNKKLIDFLTRPDILEELVTYITTEPSADLDERERYKHANMACELLTTDIPHLSEKLMGDEQLLLKLYSFLESEPPLNPLLASFFSRTMGMFLTRRQEQNWYSYQLTCLKLLDFLRNKETCIPLLMKHLGTLAVMDLTLKLATQVEDEEMRWLDKQQLIDLVVELLDPAVDSDRHSSASQLLQDIVLGSRDALLNADSKSESNVILKTIESPKTVVKLLDLILKGEKCESSIVGGITVLLTLLEPANSRIQVYKLYSRVDNIHDNYCICELQKPSLKMTCGVVDPPFGKTRLHVAKLLVALIATHNPNINQSLHELGTIGVLLDLFFKYTWNNFLHTQVEKCLSFAINCDLLNCEEISKENVLLHDVFVTCNLLQRIVNTWNENDEEQKQPGGCRRGYMGHLFRIVVKTGGGEHPARASTQDSKDYSDISQYANAQQL
ncbi:serine/threonine-protein phosphatase 6 regulatory subunit 3 [Nilaparvata lugens]|uniref:serine/threonine-protein phosphatase 6 regulatory subunit 3 n=1 Tax=Nilaparvata lugens TaxID=108931 RepID=UPI00193E2FE4|nr:serine/threonine-protein phosphatase 6 regulatory subunit 3 [Nilaparvata lugens]